MSLDVVTSACQSYGEAVPLGMNGSHGPLLICLTLQDLVCRVHTNQRGLPSVVVSDQEVCGCKTVSCLQSRKTCLDLYHEDFVNF